ncbi:hypothetical protein D3C84_176090 [compost metagenome]|uniref:hypothetical protein n=1 Tax=Pseudomonas sp. ACN8 TaxID=1920428 RepID=UPI000FA40726|nr:hypothetical protein [Pseudomonas sp. ACN8]PBJ19310.1 hypothetical protein BSF44_46840 [Pseudomonas sp. ACN8]
MIYAFSPVSKLLIKYDVCTGSAYVASCSSANVRRYIQFVPAFKVGGDCPYSEMLYKERTMTRYGQAGRLNAINKMHAKANKFGRFSEAEEGIYNLGLEKLELCRKEISILNKIISVFENRGVTDWQFEGVGRGALRVYPSNGAIHSFRPRIIFKKYTVDYFPCSKSFSISKNKVEVDHNCLYVICEIDRVLEKYSDVGALVALYIEFGHLVSALLFFAGLAIGSLSLTSLEKEIHQAAVFARLTL